MLHLVKIAIFLSVALPFLAFALWVFVMILPAISNAPMLVVFLVVVGFITIRLLQFWRP